MAQRIPRDESLSRVHGVGALFSAAYGNVGSSIYYALGVTAAFALGLTPVAFVISGLIFAATAATYAEATVMYPEAGGSSSFARHAFNELVSFVAAWGQMLNYTITVAISAYFVPHYLAVFWEPLGHAPGDIIGGAVLIGALALLNIRGSQESAKLNLVLAVADLATQVVLVGIGVVLVLSPQVLVDNIHLGVAPTWSDFALGIAVAMIAYTGIETISNMAEEAKDAARTIPRSVGLTVAAVLGLYLLIPVVALSAMPVVQNAAGHYTTALGSEFANDPILGIVENLGLGSGLTEALRFYVGILAAVILLIATNAGLIGVSRLTYSMGQHRQLPEGLRQVHPRYRTPYIAILVFAGLAMITLIPGQAEFLATLYSFGAMLSFTIAHVSVIQLRRRKSERGAALEAAAQLPRLRLRGAADRGAGRPWHVRRLDRGDGAQPAHPRRRDRLDGLRHCRLRPLPSQPETAADRDGQSRHAGAARRRGDRVPQHPGRLRGRRAVLRGDGRDGGQARLQAASRRPHPLDADRANRPAARRRAARSGSRGAEQGGAGEADRRPAGDRSRRAGAAGAGRLLDLRRGEADQRRRGRRRAALPQRRAALRQDPADRSRRAALPRHRRLRQERRSVPRSALSWPRIAGMSSPERIYRGSIRASPSSSSPSAWLILVSTLVNGGGPLSVGVLMGLAFAAVGGGAALGGLADEPVSTPERPKRSRLEPLLHRGLGVPGLFVAVYSAVGFSIYFALGVVADRGLGLTPLIFLAAGLLFVLTTLSYVEGGAMFRERGGSSSFARHAFNELIAFIAGWAILIDYLIVAALAAISVPHYLEPISGDLCRAGLGDRRRRRW